MRLFAERVDVGRKADAADNLYLSALAASGDKKQINSALSKLSG